MRDWETMEGTMIWFNVDKGYGFIRTEEDERLYVAQTGFLPDQQPEPRCKGKAVSFEREDTDGDPRAVNVTFLTQEDPRRARIRHAAAAARTRRPLDEDPRAHCGELMPPSPSS